MEAEGASSLSPVSTASAPMVSLLSCSPLPAPSLPSTQPCAHGYGPAQPPLITPPFPSLEKNNLGCPTGTVSPTAVSDLCRLSYLSSWGGGWERRAPSINLGTPRAPVSNTRVCSSCARLRSILCKDLQGESRAQMVWGEGTGRWVGCQAPSFPKAASCSLRGTSGLPVSVLAELSIKQIPARKEESSMS